jgi:hypothetical protein
MVEIERDDGGPPDGGLPNDAITVPPKMCIPGVSAWIEQRSLVASLKINACDTVGLV